MLVAWAVGRGRNAKEEAYTRAGHQQASGSGGGSGPGGTVAEASRQIGVTEQTFYRWRNEYGGLRIDQVKRFKQLELENTRLKRAVADLTLDNQILKEAVEGNF